MIFFLNLGPVVGGQERAIEEYFSKLQESDRVNHIFCFRNIDGISLKPNFFVSKFPVFWLLKQLVYNKLKKHDIATVVLVGNRAAFLWPIFIIFARTYLYLHTEIDFDHGIKSVVRKQLLSFAILGTEKTFSVGDTVAQLSQNEKKIISVVPDFPEINKERIIKPLETYTFLYCGEITEKKGCVDLIFAFSKLPQTYQLTLVGRLNSDQILQRLNTTPNIEVFPFTDSKELLLQHYQVADFYVSLSRTESFGLSVLMALQCALPVICTNISGHRKILGDYYPLFLNNQTGRNEIHQEILRISQYKHAKNFKKSMEKLRESRVQKLKHTCFSKKFLEEIYLEQ